MTAQKSARGVDNTTSAGAHQNISSIDSIMYVLMKADASLLANELSCHLAAASFASLSGFRHIAGGGSQIPNSLFSSFTF